VLHQQDFDFSQVCDPGSGHANSGGKDGGGRIPVLETEQGCIFSTTAIARYLARLRRDVVLFGGIVLDGGMIDSWIEFCVHEVEVGLFQSASMRLDVILWDAHQGSLRRLDSRCQKLAQSTCRIDFSSTGGCREVPHNVG